jgi:hypothetical protein
MATLAEEGALRAACTALHANGGFDVVLRLPGLAVSGSDAEQLGLGTPQFQDVPVGPAVWRKVGVNKELLLAASAVTGLLGSLSFVSAESLFESAVGVVVGDVVYVITQCQALCVAGVPSAYRLKVQEPSWT